MADLQKVYTKVVKTLKEMMEMSHQGHLVALAMMIMCIVLNRNVKMKQGVQEWVLPILEHPYLAFR